MRNMEGRRAMSLQPLHNEQGVILVIALIFTCVLAIAGTMAYQMTASELLIARNFDSSKGALNAAGTGLEEARAALGLPSTNPPGIAPNAIYDPATSYPDPLWTAYILTSAAWQTSDDTDYNSSDTNYFPTGASFSDQSNTTITANSLQSDLSYWVKIRHKMESGNFIYYGCEDPSSDPTITAFASSAATEFRPVDIITSSYPGDSVSGERGGSTIRTEVVHDPGPPILAALYAEWEVDGDTTSHTVTISGTDICTPGDCPMCQNVSKSDVYFYPSTGDPRIDDPDINPIYDPSDPAYDPNAPAIELGDINLDVGQGITSLRVWETSTTPSDCYNSDYKICSYEGDLTVTTQTGTGILMVQGNLTLDETNWNGLILVTGELTLNGGSGGITIEGAVLVNNQVWINDANKGNVTIDYNSCAIDAALSSIPLRILKWEDLSVTQ